MSEWKANRFWKETLVSECEDGFAVQLDGRPVKTPAKAALVLPTRGFADAVRAEWDAVEELIDPNKMPFTRTANAAIDKVVLQHGEVADMIADYGGTDLLCYRADSPAELRARQDATWDPLLDWATQTYGAKLEVTSGVMHLAQSEAALAPLRKRVHEASNFELAALHDLVSLSGSLVIGLAATKQVQPDDALWAMSRIDETWQEEQWGEDEEASAQAEIKRQAFLHAARVWRLSQVE
ncbi:ATPase [Primorskyibacter aestuariivivens]|uniref:ATP12 family chaperone protein n=1 Tax=Primorskyibacter aestuariivivens TaxID=1888912 RepID=UPI0023000AD4|nr:ATP12 family protein [Primorskyibacter aestuariivivens]MDA7430408.1 ATPase [Primorskyibacter aestuariivivens]